MNHITLIHTIPSYFFKIYFNISSLPSMFSKHRLYSFLFSSMYATGQEKFVSLDLNNLILFARRTITKVLNMQLVLILQFVKFSLHSMSL